MITWWLTFALAEPAPEPLPSPEAQTEPAEEGPTEDTPPPELSPSAPEGERGAAPEDVSLPEVDTAPPVSPAATEGASAADTPVVEPSEHTADPPPDEGAVAPTAPQTAPVPHASHADSGHAESPPISVEPVAAAPPPVPVVVAEPETTVEDATDLVSYLPVLPSDDQWTAPLLLLGALLAWTLGQLARLAQSRLSPTGVLPSTTRALQALGRTGAVLLVLAAFVALRPEGPVATLVVLGGALAVGWSLRDALPDMVAWVFLIAEGRIRTGMWVRGDAYEGRIDAIGPRATFVVGTRGEQTSVPNRRLLRDAVQTSPEPFTSADVRVVLPGVAAPRARSAIQEAVLLSPWLAPGSTAEIGQDPGSPNTWIVRVRLLDGVFREAFEGSLPARIHAVLTTPASSIGS